MHTTSHHFRRITAFVIAFFAVGLLCAGSVLAGAKPPSSDWPQTRADAADSNRNPHETTLTAQLIESGGFGAFLPDYSLAVLPPYGQCGTGRIRSAKPVVAGSKLYFFNGRFLDAYDLDSGVRRWRYDLAGSFGSWEVYDLAVAGGKVLLGTHGACASQSDPDGSVFAFDASSGALVWQKTAGAVATDLSISGTTVVTATAPDVNEQGLRAYRLGTGALIWARDDCAALNTFVVASTVMTDTCGSLDLRTGATIWSKPGWSLMRGDGPKISDPAIYATNPQGELVALRPDGTVKWNAGAAYGTVHAAGPVRIFVRCDQDSLCALDRTTGARAWKVPGYSLPPDGLVTASDFALTTYGTFLRASDGTEINQLGNLWGEPGVWDWIAVAGAHVIATSDRTVDVLALNEK